jgi:tetratricopeptide (TPR) repeat protein
MSILYNRLKNVEKEKKPDILLDKEEDFPIDGEIKRQKEERRHKIRLGIMVGMFLFVLSIYIGPKIVSIIKAPKPVKSALKQKPAPPKKTAPVAAQADLKQTEPPAAQSAPPAKDSKDFVKPPVETAALPDNLFEQGVELYKQTKYSEAAAAYKKGLQEYPQQAVGYNNLGAIYYRQDRLKKALAQLKLAVELNPQYAEAHYNLAVILEKLGQDKKALIHYLKFLELASPEHQPLQEKVKAHVRYYY